MSQPMSLDVLRQAIAGHAAAFRCVSELQPVGGPGDKIFPPTYSGGAYATEKRRIPGADDSVDCVLLDSVQSQANRMELALLEEWERGNFPLPVVSVDFSGQDMPKVFRVTSLEAPHRIVDALLRDSVTADGKPFRKSELGQKLDFLDNRNATALFQLCPTALIFGLWDSTGPRGGLGAKFARAVVSEIIGIDVIPGVKTKSRIDPAQITIGAGPVYHAKDGGWTVTESQALLEKGKPKKVGKEGKPSETNHGNVTPTISDGGFTIRYARQTTTLSLPALRRLRFPVNGTADSSKDEAARIVLAALALCAATLAREMGGDLRSRCHLSSSAEPIWELIEHPGQPPMTFTLDRKRAVELYSKAVNTAKSSGLPWLDDEFKLAPSPQLLALVKKSQELAASVAIDDGDL